MLMPMSIRLCWRKEARIPSGRATNKLRVKPATNSSKLAGARSITNSHVGY